MKTMPLRLFPFEAVNRDIAMICVSNFIGAFGEGLYFYVLPLHILSLQANPVEMGLVFSALYLVSAIMPIPGGYLADRFDRRRVVFFAWIPWALSPIAYSLATHWALLVPGAVLWGLSFIGGPAISAYVITSVRDKSRIASVVSLVWGTYTLGYVFSPAIGGFIAVAFNMTVVFYLSALLSGVATCFYLFISPQIPKRLTKADRNEKENVASAAGNNTDALGAKRKMVTWVLFYALAVFAIGLTRPYTPVFLEQRLSLNAFQVGLFGSVSYLGSSVLGVALGVFGDRWKSRSRAVTASLTLFFLSIVTFMLVQNYWLLLPVAFAMGGSLMIGSIISSIVGSLSPSESRGKWMALPQTSSMFANFAAPFLGGFLYEASPYYPFVFASALMPFLIMLSLMHLMRD